MPNDFRRFSQDADRPPRPPRAAPGGAGPHRPRPVSPFADDDRRPPEAGFRPPARGPRPAARLSAGPPPPGSEAWPTPWVQMKYYTNAPAVFPRFIGSWSPGARAGDLVHVFDKEGRPFGSGFFNPPARIPLRMLQHGPDPAREEALEDHVGAVPDLVDVVARRSHEQPYHLAQGMLVVAPLITPRQSLQRAASGM